MGRLLVQSTPLQGITGRPGLEKTVGTGCLKGYKTSLSFGGRITSKRADRFIPLHSSLRGRCGHCTCLACTVHCRGMILVIICVCCQIVDSRLSSRDSKHITVVYATLVECSSQFKPLGSKQAGTAMRHPCRSHDSNPTDTTCRKRPDAQLRRARSSCGEYTAKGETERGGVGINSQPNI